MNYNVIERDISIDEIIEAINEKRVKKINIIL